ncbi:hypothetical protein [Flexivirga oryzae]|uniref:Uncharacterized protein n=1 Tax=Flexivirga oryzae TaxID=1794944 RepID=A0A839N5P2_9MICO|nr:hypothetical protein [Flexivirga oryzae]MBB2890956.1 hypothetical protein [Flexivirga oryzae]
MSRRDLGIALLKYCGRTAVVFGITLIALAASIYAKTPVARVSSGGPDYRIAAFAPAALGIVLASVGAWLASRARAMEYFEIQDGLQIQGIPDVDAPNEDVESPYSSRTISVALAALIKVDRINVRVHDRAELTEYTIEHNVQRQVNMERVVQRLNTAKTGADARGPLFAPKEPPLEWLYPLLRHTKGQALSRTDFMIDGVSADTLPSEQNITVTSMIVRRLFLLCIPRASAEEEELNLLRESLAVCESREPTAVRTFEDLVTRLQDRWKQLDGAEALQDMAVLESVPANRRLFLMLMRHLATYYVVWMQLPGPRCRIDLSYHESRRYLNVGLSGRIRRYMGVPNLRYRIRVPEATDAASYHFQAMAPPDTYLFAGNVRLPSESRMRTAAITNIGNDLSREAQAGTNQNSASATRPGLRVIAKMAQASVVSVHFHARQLRSEISPHSVDERGDERKRAKGLYLDLAFVPIPPSAESAILGLSVYLALICSAIAFYQDRLFKHGEPGTAGTVVLGIPVLLSAWVASRFDYTGLRRATPVLISEMVSLTFVAVLAEGIMLFKESKKSYETDRFPSVLYDWLHLVGHPWWMLVWVLSMAQVGYVIVTFGSRQRRFRRAMRTAGHTN